MYELETIRGSIPFKCPKCDTLLEIGNSDGNLFDNSDFAYSIDRPFGRVNLLVNCKKCNRVDIIPIIDNLTEKELIFYKQAFASLDIKEDV